MRRLFLVVVVVVAAATVALWLAGLSLLIPRLEAAATRATGHAARIGAVTLGWTSGPSLRLHHVTLANPAWAARPELLTIARATIDFDAAALWQGIVRVSQIRLEQPDLLLEMRAGQGNWQPDPAPAPSPAVPARPGASAVIDFGLVIVVGGHVTYRNHRLAGLYEATLDGTIDAAAHPIRVDAQVHIDQTKFHVVAGFAPGLMARVAGAGIDVDFSAPTLDPVDPRGPVTIEAALAPGSLAYARAGLADWGSVTAHAVLGRADQTITLDDLRLNTPAGDMQGGLALVLGVRPSVRGHLSSAHLDLGKLPVAASPPPGPAAAAANTTPAPATPPPVLPWRWLDRADGDLKLAAAELRDGTVTLREVAGHAALAAGRLTLDGLRATGPGGTATATMQADGRAVPPTIAATLHAPTLDPGPMLALAGIDGSLSGHAALDADLRAAGDTWAALLRTLAGRASISLVDGDLDLHLLAGVLAASHLPIDSRTRAHLRCLVARAAIEAGVAQVNPLVIDAGVLLVQGGGSVDLVQHTLALRLRPLLRTGPGLIVPMRLAGPWAKPRIEVDSGDLGGVLAGLAASGGDACRAAGVTPTSLAPITKPPKPADLLRSLLR